MADAPRPRGGRAALLFALAALAACWNPIAAPFGLAVGIGAAVLAGVARRKGARGRASVALVLGIVAAVASAAVLALSAGTVTNEIPGTPVVKARSPDEANRLLDDAAARTRAERERARKELDATKQSSPDGAGARPAGAPPPAPDQDRR